MDNYTSERVVNGTFADVWIDEQLMAEATALEAKLKLDVTEVKMLRTLYKGYKVTGISGSGTLKLNKVSSYFVDKMLDNIRNGKATRATITSNLDDPEAFGAERIVIKDCVFTELTLADWESGKLLEESIPFNFSDAELTEKMGIE